MGIPTIELLLLLRAVIFLSLFDTKVFVVKEGEGLWSIRHNGRLHFNTANPRLHVFEGLEPDGGMAWDEPVQV